MDESKKKWMLQKARELRKFQTPQETELWAIIRGKRFETLKFYRQYIIGSYIVDFYCPQKMLVIEIDGGQHTQTENEDRKRDKYLCELGYRVVRIWNSDWNCNRDGVLERIANFADSPSPAPSGHPPPAGGGESAK